VLLKGLVGKTLQQFDAAGEMLVSPSSEMFWLIILEQDGALGFRRCTSVTGRVRGCDPFRRFTSIDGSSEEARVEVDGLGAATLAKVPDRSWVKVKWSGPPFGSGSFKAWLQDDAVASAALGGLGSAPAATASDSAGAHAEVEQLIALADNGIREETWNTMEKKCASGELRLYSQPPGDAGGSRLRVETKAGVETYYFAPDRKPKAKWGWLRSALIERKGDDGTVSKARVHFDAEGKRVLDETGGASFSLKLPDEGAYAAYEAPCRRK
jgi:hypothetical protein